MVAFGLACRAPGDGAEPGPDDPTAVDALHVQPLPATAGAAGKVGADEDTDLPAPAGLPTLTWRELFTEGGLCVPPSCTTRWSDPLDLFNPNPVTYVHVVAGGWRVASADDPWFTVLADVERDTDGDGDLDTRGLVLAWDPVSRSLIDHPLLPDDFVALGLVLPDDFDRELRGLSIVDVDDDGVSEVVQAIQPRTPLLRFDPAEDVLRPVGEFRGATLDDALAAGPTNLGVIDLDNDGLLDLEWPSMPFVQDSAIVTFVQAGVGTWEQQTLYTRQDGWSTGSGLGALWPEAGEVPLRIMPGNVMGECFTPRLAPGPVLTSDLYPLFDPCLLSAPSAGPGMGTATVDLNGDGRQEIVSTRNQSHLLYVVDVVDVRTAQLFGASALYGATLPLALDRPLSIVPWAVGPGDLNRDGWRDLVVAAGEDYTFNAPCETLDNCLRVQPVGIWINSGVAPGVDRSTAHPLQQNLPIDHVLGAVPPIGDFNGGLFVNVDGDGDQDMLFSPVYGGEPRMYLDDTEGPNRGFCLRGRGTTSNALGIGSVIEVETPDGEVQTLQLGGEGGPNVRTGQPEVCLGTGAASEATVRWTWPSGLRQVVTQVPAGRGSEPSAYVIEEPETISILDAGGARSARRVSVGETLTVRVCAWDPTPTRLGVASARASRAPVVRVDVTDLRGASTVASPSVAQGPSGCVDWTITSAQPGVSRLQVTSDGVESRVHPRVWWE